MSFVKVTIQLSRYPVEEHAVVLNTDWIGLIHINTLEVEMRDSERIVLTPESLDYLLVCVEAQNALAAEAPEPLSLKSRIAQALRNEFPNGADMPMLTAHFPIENALDIRSAVSSLEHDNVIVNHHRGSGAPVLYIHREYLSNKAASDKPAIPKPQP